MEELVIATQTMVGGDFHDEEAQSLRNLVEEVVEPNPRKCKKKKMGKDEASPSKARAHERNPSFVKQRKGVDEVSVGSPVKTPTTPQKQKGKEKVLEPIVEFEKHVDFHSLESNGNVNSLIAPLGVLRQKGGKQALALECSIVDESPEKQEEEGPTVGSLSKEFLSCGRLFCVCGPTRGNHIT